VAVEALVAQLEFSRLDRAVVGISGGSDSTALLVMLRERIRQTGAGTKLLAVTVDHKLRMEAEAEARKTGEFCASLGIPHKTIAWERQEALRSGVAAAARTARYGILSKAADDFSANVILTGHTLDDQIETVAMRLARGKGRGLAGIAPLTLFDRHVWIARPLLEARREGLRAYLKDRGVGWVDDASNTDDRNERARVRKELSSASQGHIRKLADIRREAQIVRIAQANAAARLIDGHAHRPAPGLVGIDGQAVLAGAEGSITAMRALIAVLGGNTHLPDFHRVQKLLDSFKPGNRRTSLGGCVIERFGDVVYVWREFRGSGPHPAKAVHGAAWDGRWRLTADVDAKATRISALGKHGKLPSCESRNAPPQGIRKAAAAALPVLSGEGERGDSEPIEFDPLSFTPVLAPWREFLPVFDVALAIAVAKLLCGAELPEIPAALKKLSPI
jgi:tRNA(Ile)-lysidine synthase